MSKKRNYTDKDKLQINGRHVELFEKSLDGIEHILFNMYALYIFGSQIEGFIGKTKFLPVTKDNRLEENKNTIYNKTGLVTFSGTNFKTIATDQTHYSLNEAIKRFVNGN